MSIIIAFLAAILAVLLGAGAFTAVLTGSFVLVIAAFVNYLYVSIVDSTSNWR